MSLEVEEIVQSPPLKKRKINLLASTNKCPVMALNEMKSDVVYTFSETGPSHAKIFQSTVVLNNQTFTAQDTTKKKAKKRVAEIILQSAIQLRDPTICNQWQSNDKNPAQDFSSDPSEAVQSSSHFYSFEASVDRSGQPQPHSVSPVDHSQSSPLYYLKRLRPGIKVEIVKTQGSAHARIFTAEGKHFPLVQQSIISYSLFYCPVELEDKKYEGIGPNKKQAMNTAAQEALRSVFLVELPKPVVEAQTNEFGDVIARYLVLKQTLNDEKLIISITIEQTGGEHLRRTHQRSGLQRFPLQGPGRSGDDQRPAAGRCRCSQYCHGE